MSNKKRGHSCGRAGMPARKIKEPARYFNDPDSWVYIARLRDSYYVAHVDVADCRSCVLDKWYPMCDLTAFLMRLNVLRPTLDEVIDGP